MENRYEFIIEKLNYDQSLDAGIKTNSYFLGNSEDRKTDMNKEI